MRSLKRYLISRPIKKTILSLFISILLALCIVAVVVFNAIFYNTYFDLTANNILGELELVNDSTEHYLDTIQAHNTNLILSLNSAFRQIEENNFDSVEYQETIADVLSNTYRLSKNISSIYYVDETGLLHTNVFSLWDKENIDMSAPLTDFTNTNDLIAFLPPEKANDLLLFEEETSAAFMCKVRDIKNNTQKGILIYEIPMQLLGSAANEAIMNTSTKSILLSSNYTSIYSTDPDFVATNEKLNINLSTISAPSVVTTQSINGTPYMFVYDNLKSYDLSVALAIPISTITQHSLNLSGIFILCFLVFSIILYYVLKRIVTVVTAPINELSAHLNSHKNGELIKYLDEPISYEGKVLINSFNDLVSTNSNLILNLNKQHEQKRKYELSLLQEQIKPHFLYNSLDTIVSLVDIESYTQARKSAKLLADYYRTVLNNGQEIVTLKEELRNVELYIELQRIRFCQNFDYTTDIDEDLLDIKIPKLTLQPIVENSIYHGLRTLKEHGLIKVSAFKRGNVINICVADNGVGIIAEKIPNFNLHKNTVSESFALENIYTRLKLYTSDNVKMAVSPLSPHGTLVTISISKHNFCTNNNG